MSVSSLARRLRDVTMLCLTRLVAIGGLLVSTGQAQVLDGRHVASPAVTPYYSAKLKGTFDLQQWTVRNQRYWGAKVVRLDADSPLLSSGVKSGDLIIELDMIPVGQGRVWDAIHRVWQLPRLELHYGRTAVRILKAADGAEENTLVNLGPARPRFGQEERTRYTYSAEPGPPDTSPSAPQLPSWNMGTIVVSGPLASRFPKFPWPPPQASDVLTMRRSDFTTPALQTLSDASDRLTDSLNRCGYSGPRFYAIPSGFALVTRLERFQGSDGRTSDPRWSVEHPSINRWSLSDYLTRLLYAPEGYFRVIVFAVTSESFGSSDERPTPEVAEAWLNEGLNSLPASIGQQPFTAQHLVTVLIYEFERIGEDSSVNYKIPGRLRANKHLNGSGLTQAMGVAP